MINTRTDDQAVVREERQPPFKMLPDAVMDDNGLSNEAKLAYWYLKRIAGYGDSRARISVGKLATKLHFSSTSKRSARGWIDELVKAGWLHVVYHSRTGPDGKVEHLASEYVVYGVACPPEPADPRVGAGEHLDAGENVAAPDPPGGVGAGEHLGGGPRAPRVGAGEPPCSRKVFTEEGLYQEGSKSFSRAARSNEQSRLDPGRDRGDEPPDETSEVAAESPVLQDPNQHVGDQQPRRRRGCRIPDDFAVTPEMVTWAHRHAPHVDGRLQTAKFVDYWQAKAGKDATKLDWVATWRNWMRNAEEQAGRYPRNGNGHRVPTSEIVVSEVSSAIREFYSGGQPGLPGGIQ